MAVVISIANQKGGVGKTTLTMNLGYGLAERGKRVLLIDIDPQFNLTFGLIGMSVLEHEKANVGTLMTKESSIEDATVKVRKNIDLIPSHLNLSAKEIEIINTYNRERRLEKMLIPVLPDYDYVLIDNPPSMGIFLVNSLTASDYVIIPLELSYFGVIGMQLMFNLMRMIREENERKPQTPRTRPQQVHEADQGAEDAPEGAQGRLPRRTDFDDHTKGNSPRKSPEPGPQHIRIRREGKGGEGVFKTYR